MSRERRRAIREVPISEFKAKCLSLLHEVNKTKTPLRVTRRGQAVADVIPAAPDKGVPAWIGSMSDRLTIVGDVLSPVVDLKDFEATSE